MNLTDSKILLDSSAWLAYFMGANLEVKECIESKSTMLFTSVLSIHEVKKKLIKHSNEREAKQVIEFMKENSVLIELTDEISENAVSDCIKHQLHTIDALIYRTAINNGAVLLTGDNDFQGLEKTRILK